jgi:REP element-mobilizing transposase RayT
MRDGERYTKRCHRWDFAGHAHELTFNCYMNRSFLSRERTCGYLIETMRYIHNNPVRKGLVQTPREWYYSSAADWENGKPGPLPVDHDSFPTH